MKFTMRPLNDATIDADADINLNGVNFVSVSVEVTCNGYEGQVDVMWSRAYPKGEYPGAESEWDVPHFNMPAWDACNGTISRSDRMRTYECLLDVTDRYFGRFIKGM